MKVSAVFLDRDGVINKKADEHDYVKKWEEFFFLPKVFEAIKLLNQNKILVIVVTNQRGIARGLFTVKDLETIHNKMQDEFISHGACIDAIYCCPHNYKDLCSCRKPKPGLLLKAASDYNLKIDETVMIGDSESDIETGLNAKCKTILLTSTDKFKAWDHKPDYTAKDLYNAVGLILNKQIS